MLALLCCFLYSCKKKGKDPIPNDPAPADTLALSDNLYIIDGTSVRTPDSNFMSSTMKLTGSNLVSGEFKFTGANIPAIQPGDFIASAGGYGYLRAVVSVVGYSSTAVTLNTKQAALEDVIEKATIYLSMTPDVSQHSLNNITFPNTGSASLKILNGGTVTFGPTYTLKMEFDNHKLQLLEMRAAQTSFTNNLELRLTANNTGSINITDYPVKKFTKKFVANVGKLPIAIEMNIELLATVQATYNIPSQTIGQSAWFSSNATTTTGLLYSMGKWSFTEATERKFNYTPEICEFDGDMQASLTPKVELSIYGVKGLAVSLKDTNWFDGSFNYTTRDWYMTWESFMQAGGGANPAILGRSVPTYNIMRDVPNTKHSGKAPFEIKRISGYDVAGMSNGKISQAVMQVVNYQGLPLYGVPVHFSMGNETGPSPGSAMFFPEAAISVSGGNASTNWVFGDGEAWNAQAKIKKPDGTVLYTVGLNAKK